MVIRTHLDVLAALPITVLESDSLCLFPTVNYPSKYWNRASKDELQEAQCLCTVLVAGVSCEGLKSVSH